MPKNSKSIFVFLDPISTEFQRLLTQRRFEQFWITFVEKSATEKSVEALALESISQVMKKNKDLSYSDVRLMTKMSGQILELVDRKSVEFSLKFLVANLENILASWVAKNIDDVCSFLRDLIADGTLSSIGIKLNISILKLLCNDIGAYSELKFHIFDKENIFETVKKISYSIETLSEEFVMAPSSKEFLIMSKMYLGSLEKIVNKLVTSNGPLDQVIWAYGRQSSWLKWLNIARKNEIEAEKGRASKGLLIATIEAHTSEALIKIDWSLFEFCCSRRNWREAAATLPRIFLENCLDVEKVCKAFINLKFLILTDTRISSFDSSLTLYELAVRQLRILELFSSTEYEDKKANVDAEEWTELAFFECDMYRRVNDVLFEREIGLLNKVLNLDDDDGSSSGCSCGSL